jgi:type IV secretion system protein TrbL
MLMAGFAPYLSYKAIAFMGFDMYHAMSAEQEAKASLNRPMPFPLSRRTGSEPAKILGDGGGGTGGSPAAVPSGGGPMPTSGGGPAAGASGGGAAAGGAVAAGAVVAKEAAAAGPRLGGFVATQSTGQAEAHESAAPSSVPPPVAESTLAAPAGRK